MEKQLPFESCISAQLEKDGYVVISNVLNTKKCDYYINEIWNWLEDLGIKRNNPETWNSKYWPLNFKGMIIYPSITHTEFSWKLRSEPTIINIFKDIWEHEDLLVNFSRMNITKPFDISSSKAKSKIKSIDSEYWFHIDQIDKSTDFHCIQGFINLEDCSSNDSGLVVIRGSHKYHYDTIERFSKEMIMSEENYFELNKKIISWLIEIKRCNIAHVAVPKGGFVLWDSRTFHCNSRPTKFSTPGRFRYVQYISMVPQAWITTEELEKKKEAFFNMKSTSAWPHKITVFSEKPKWAYNIDLSHFDQSLQMDLPIMTKRMLLLIGFNEIECNNIIDEQKQGSKISNVKLPLQKPKKLIKKQYL